MRKDQVINKRNAFILIGIIIAFFLGSCIFQKVQHYIICKDNPYGYGCTNYEHLDFEKIENESPEDR